MLSEKNITPTLTLAKLYEAQKQYFDVYTIYKKLYQISPTEDIKERMENIQGKIFVEKNLIYHELISKILTPEDRATFKILPSQSYQSLVDAMNTDYQQSPEYVEEEEFPEDDIDIATADNDEDDTEFTQVDTSATGGDTLSPTGFETDIDYTTPATISESTLDPSLATQSDIDAEMDTETAVGANIETEIKVDTKPGVKQTGFVPPPAKKIISTTVASKKHKPTATDPKMDDMTIAGFSKYLRENFDKNKKISELTISEFREIKKIFFDLL
jgi:hypothetical protein